MRQEQINIYTINDHPNKELCFEWIRNNWHDLGQHWVDDMIESLRALQKAVGGDLTFSIGIEPDRSEHVTLKGYDKDALNELNKIREESPLTGMRYDYDVIQGLYNESNGDFTLADYVLKALHDEGEYIYSDEGLQEMCECSEYEFYECGKVV